MISTIRMAEKPGPVILRSYLLANLPTIISGAILHYNNFCLLGLN